jgi:NTP pyrophosphatase (non-canonical NTP hydrolase)
VDSITETVAAIVAFRDERDWAQFHTPRNLAAALAIEAAELQELLLWKSDQEIDAVLAESKGRNKLQEELGDVLIFTLLLSHSCGIDPLKAVQQKLRVNAAKYPVEKARGISTKYTEL